MLGFCWGFGCKGDQGAGPHPRTLVGFWGVFVGLLGVLAGVLAWVLLRVGWGCAWVWLGVGWLFCMMALLGFGWALVWIFWVFGCCFGGVWVCLGFAELWLDVWMGCG